VKNELVAVKVMERKDSSLAHNVQSEITVLQRLTRLAKEEDFQHIITLRDVVYENGDAEYNPDGFKDAFLILEPCVTRTFVSAIEKPLAEKEMLKLFREALLGLHFLHTHGFIHVDIKPANIGIRDTPEPTTVLLDIGGAVCPKNGQVEHAPGHRGTINYLAPEMEMQPYDARVDVWAMGVVGFQLKFGFHPWKLSVNPWKPGASYLRPLFEHKYTKAVRLMHAENAQPVGGLLAQMLRYPWAPPNVNGGARITVDEALKRVFHSPQ
jgi:serine/threonine protein kinase